jgi:hypothetical protein
LSRQNLSKRATIGAGDEEKEWNVGVMERWNTALRLAITPLLQFVSAVGGCGTPLYLLIHFTSYEGRTRQTTRSESERRRDQLRYLSSRDAAESDRAADS